MSLTAGFTPATAAPRAGPLAVAWGLPVLLSAEAALWHLWPSPRGPAAAMAGFGAAFLIALAVSSAARDLVIEATSDLSHVTRFWLAVLHGGVFVLPLLITRAQGHPAPWPVGCVALALLLCLRLVRAEACHLLLATLLVLWWGLLALRPDVPAAWPLAALGLILIALGVTHVHFRHVHFRRSGAGYGPALLAGPVTMALALPAGWGLWWLIPDSLFVPPPAPASGGSGPAPLVMTGEMRVGLQRLLLELLALTVLGMAVIIVLGRWLKRWRGRPRPVPIEVADFSSEQAMWDVPPEPRRRRRVGHTPREQIVEAYLHAVDAMVRRGWDFPASMTAREFWETAAGRHFPAREALGVLTDLFERAKYGEGAADSDGLRSAFSAAREVLTSVEHR